MEIWKPVKGYEGKYEVSSLGRVKSLSRKVSTPFGYNTKHLPEKILKESSTTNQSRVCLCKNNVPISTVVHRIVAFAFLGDPPGEYGNKKGNWCVHHIDGNGHNNHIDNLKWRQI